MATVGGMSSLKDSQSSLQTAVRKFTSQITTPVYRVSHLSYMDQLSMYVYTMCADRPLSLLMYHSVL